MNQAPDPRPLRRRVGRALGILLAGLLAFSGAPAASAGPPVFEEPFTVEGEAVLAGRGDFPVLDR